jgi:hypothetical protein
MFIGKFQAYPIYKMSFKWTQLDPKTNQRVDNYSSFERMFKQELTEVEIDELIVKYKSDYSEKYSELDIEFNSGTITFFEYETWTCGWFCHSSFNYHLSNEDILESFSEYVSRYEGLHETDPKYRCLMGADDRWRWTARDPVDHTKESPPPCRCNTCIEQGVVRIFH